MSDSNSNFPNPFDAPPPLPGGGPYGGAPTRRTTSGKAVAAVVLGLFSPIFWVLAAIPAIVLGLIAQSEVGAHPERLRGRGLAWMGVLLGVIGLVLPFVWLSMLINTIDGERAFASLPGRDRIVHLHLGGGVSEQPYEDVPAIFSTAGQSLKGLVDRLDHAREDSTVKAVLLTVDQPAIGLGQIEELSKAVRALVKAGKPVYAHAGDIQTGAYALLAGATSINVVPTDSLWLTGMQFQSLYLGELFDSIGVQAEVMQMGDFKAAGEMFTREAPSAPASENMEWLVDGLYGSVVDMIAKGRNLDPEKVRALIDQGPYEAQAAKDAGLVDSVLHLDQFLDEIKEKHGENIYFDNHYLEGPKGRKGSFGTLAKGSYDSSIALIYVEGMIMRGYEQVSPFGGAGGAYSGDIVKTLEAARTHPDVHAVVLRIDSPGGSAVASEEILRAVTRVQEAGMPVVVSMGSTAASGGYYIACKADAIYADASTITASIGVVGGKVATEELWNSLGVHWHAWKRGENADLLDFVHPFTPEQRTKMEGWMGETYKAFTGHVVDGRGSKLTKPIEELAGGRVFTGAQARDLGLVDEIGGLEEAVAKAAELAELKPGHYSLRVLPEYMSFWEAFFTAMRGEQSSATDVYAYSPVQRDGWLSRLPIPGMAGDPRLAALDRLAPSESRAVAQALTAAQLLSEEKVLALMPEIKLAQ